METYKSKQQVDACDLQFRKVANEARNTVWKLTVFARPRQPQLLMALFPSLWFFLKLTSFAVVSDRSVILLRTMWGAAALCDIVSPLKGQLMRRALPYSFYLTLSHHYPQRTGPLLSIDTRRPGLEPSSNTHF